AAARRRARAFPCALNRSAMKRARLVQVGVERGRHAAHEETRIIRDCQPRAIQGSHTCGDQLLEARGGEHAIRWLTVLRAYLFDVGTKIAHDAFDDLSAQSVVVS